MPLHPEVTAFVEAAGTALRFPADVLTDPATAARYLATARAASAREIAGDPEPVAEVHERRLPSGRPVRIYLPTTDAPRPVVVFFHGGGWVLGDLEMQDETCRRLANRVGATVLNVDYRLAPEHPFPAAHDDAFEAVIWAADQATAFGGDATRLAVAGMSAGGNLAASVALRARDEGGPPLALQTLIYPVLDSRMATASYAEHAEAPVLGAAQMGWYWDQYAGSGAARENPYASPAHARDLAGLPPAVVVTADHDPLRTEAEEYAARLAQAGVAVQITRYDGQLHSFMRLLGVVSDAERALDDTARAMDSKLTATRDSRGTR
jgi:acetyl esterase